MQGIHKEGEFRQLEIWTWKSYVRPPILHNSKQAETLRGFFMKYLRIIGANNHQRGATRWAQPTWVRQVPLARPGGLWPPRPTSGAHLLVYKWFWPRIKIRGGLSGWSAAVSRRNLGGALLPSGGAIPPGELPSRRGKSSSSSSPTTLPSRGGQSPSTSSTTPSPLKPSSSLVFNLVTGTIDWFLLVTSSVDYIL